MQHIQFFAQTAFKRPGLHVWRKGHELAHVRATEPHSRPGWWRFDIELLRSQTIGFKLFAWNEPGTEVEQWEADAFSRHIILRPGEELPAQIWLVEGTNRVMTRDPLAHGRSNVRVHLITANRYREGELYVWSPGLEGRRHALTDHDAHGPYFDVDLAADHRHIFNFKFIRKDGRFENDYANRTWSSADGPEVWTHSEGAEVFAVEPAHRRLRVHLQHGWEIEQPWMHLWQENSDFQTRLQGIAGPAPGWTTFEREKLYTGIEYGFMFCRTDPGQTPDSEDWEHPDARRFHTLAGDEEYYTLEGDSFLFSSMPTRNRQIAVEIAGRDPRSPVDGPIDALEVKVNKARHPLPAQFHRQPNGTWIVQTYPGIITSFRFGSGETFEEAYHRVQLPLEVPQTQPEMKMFAVLGREPLVADRPPRDLFADPPFTITRQGVVEADGHLRFVLHAPWCTRVRLWGEWMADDTLLDLQSTQDGTLWWTEIPAEQVKSELPAFFEGDYHGARYRYLLNDPTGDSANDLLNGSKYVQDPAADWVESSVPDGRSKLVNHGRYRWKSTSWRTPGPEYLMVYQLHPARFTRRNTDGSGAPVEPFLQIVREIEREGGYLRNLGTTALLLLPTAEFEGSRSWGYNPSYYYAVEEAYGGPDSLKQLVDVCHQHGVAVLMDVVFNHAGTGHNIMWETARETFFDGDTKWGALINFDDPTCRDFFAENLLFWHRNYHIDGFRFDHTKTIIDGHRADWFINRPGSGGGWEFLHDLRAAVKRVDPNCLFMAEQLPNDWMLTNYGGPMDTQWSDDFHDRLVEMCRGNDGVLGRWADAMKYSHTVCQQWYNVTNYGESHDEVGNVNDRLAHVAGDGRGMRISKVAAAATFLSRGIPMSFMGQESGERGQFFQHSNDVLNLDGYETTIDQVRVREWWKVLLALRKHNNRIQGPAPVEVHYAEGETIAFSRGEGRDYFAVLNFGPQAAVRSLAQMNMPDGTYRELWNSTWPAFQVEWEDEHTNGGREVRLDRSRALHVPDYGVVILERT